jgi:hypothetical protein
VLHRPAWDSEVAAEQAIALAAACGLILALWQQIVVRMVLAARGGRWAASECGFLVARQNGKGGVLEAIALWSLFIGGGQTLWTAHEVKTSDESYLRVVALIKASDELSAMVARWDGGLTGQHIIELRKDKSLGAASGARLAFVARSKSSGRGFSPTRIILDEAQELSVLALRALLYSTAAKKGRQLIFCGTVPDPAVNQADVWTSVRDRGRKGESTRLAWGEWTPKNSDDPRAVIDPESWEARRWANPALGSLIEAETIDSEWEAAQADIAGFLRERMSVWPSADDAGTGVLDVDAWMRGRGRLLPLVSASLVVEVAQDRRHALLMVVGQDAVGSWQVEVVPPVRGGVPRSGAGTDWLPDRVAEVVADAPQVSEVVLDSKGWAAKLADDFEVAMGAGDRQVPVRLVSAEEFVAACGEVDELVGAGAIRHSGGPVLKASIRGAIKRDRDGVWVWDRRRMGVTGLPLVAMTVGLSGAGSSESAYESSRLEVV